MPENVAAVAIAVESLVVDGPVPGARLAVQLRDLVAGWAPSEYGVRNLREFIATHVPNVTILGRTGMDVLYGPAVSTETGADHAEQVDYWRIWVSPHSPLSIAIARDDLSLRAVNRGLPVESDKVVLSPPGPDAHRAMATSFLSDVPETARLALQATLESDSDQWWQAWNRELRVFGLSEVWSKFRIGTFHDLLDNALQATGFEQSAVSRISTAIRRRRPTLRSHHQGREVAPETDASEDRDLLLRVVTEALNRLTIAELRELRLPVGAVVDALSQRKHQ